MPNTAIENPGANNTMVPSKRISQPKTSTVLAERLWPAALIKRRNMLELSPAV
jgi:hypothetical protein